MNKDELDNTIHLEVLFASIQYLSIVISHVYVKIMDSWVSPNLWVREPFKEKTLIRSN